MSEQKPRADWQERERKAYKPGDGVINRLRAYTINIPSDLNNIHRLLRALAAGQRPRNPYVCGSAEGSYTPRCVYESPPPKKHQLLDVEVQDLNAAMQLLHVKHKRHWILVASYYGLGAMAKPFPVVVRKFSLTEQQMQSEFINALHTLHGIYKPGLRAQLPRLKKVVDDGRD